MLATEKRVMHVRFAGQSADFDLDTLGLQVSASDAEVYQVLASLYGRSVEDFQDHVIVREPHAIIVRPMAIYG